MHLGTVVVLTKAKAAFGAETVGPETAEVDIGLRHLRVGNQEPETEDGLGKDVENGVGYNLGINGGLAGAIGNTPNNGVSGPDEDGEAGDGRVELANVVATGGSESTAVDDEVPDDDEEGNAGNSVPIVC